MSRLSLSIFGAPVTKLAPLPSFTPFQRLPKELRLEIWKIASFESRNVDVWIDKKGMNDEGTIELVSRFYSCSNVPAVLHACSESRTEALRHYSLDFGLETDKRYQDCPWFNPASYPPQIYINWEADRLCLMNDFFTSREAFHALLVRLSAIPLKRLAYSTQDVTVWQTQFISIMKNLFWKTPAVDFVLFTSQAERPKADLRRLSLVFTEIEETQAITDDLQFSKMVLLNMFGESTDTSLPGLSSQGTFEKRYKEDTANLKVSVCEAGWKSTSAATEREVATMSICSGLAKVYAFSAAFAFRSLESLLVARMKHIPIERKLRNCMRTYYGMDEKAISGVEIIIDVQKAILAAGLLRGMFKSTTC